MAKNKVQEKELEDESKVKSSEDSKKEKEKTTNESENTNDKSNNEKSKDSKLLEIQDELSEMKEKYLRLYSEFDNYRKRAAREKISLIESASGELIAELLPILDDFDRASKSNTDKTDPDALKEGFELIRDKFKKTLIRKGLQEMEISEGTEFDSELHEAISQVPVEKKKLKGKVIDVVEKGYTINEKVLRYAKVVVGN